jgi:hypothetical protein
MENSMGSRACSSLAILRRVHSVRLLCAAARGLSLVAQVQGAARRCGAFGSPFGPSGCVVPRTSRLPGHILLQQAHVATQ